MRGLRPGLRKAARAARLLAQFCLLHSLLTPTHWSLRGAHLLPGHLPPPGLRRPGPVGQESGTATKVKARPPSSVAYGLTSQRPQPGRPRAGWLKCLSALADHRFSGAGRGGRSGQRGCLGWCGVSGPSAAAGRLCELQRGAGPLRFQTEGLPVAHVRTAWSRV